MRSFPWRNMGIWGLFVIIKRIIWQRIPHINYTFQIILHSYRLSWHSWNVKKLLKFGDLPAPKKNPWDQKKQKPRVFGLEKELSRINAAGFMLTSHHRHWRQPGGNGAWESVGCISFWHKLIKALFLFANLVNDVTFFLQFTKKEMQSCMARSVWMCLNVYEFILKTMS